MSLTGESAMRVAPHFVRMADQSKTFLFLYVRVYARRTDKYKRNRRALSHLKKKKERERDEASGMRIHVLVFLCVWMRIHSPLASSLSLYS